MPFTFFSQIVTYPKVTDAEIYRNGYTQIYAQSEVYLRKGIHSVTMIVNGQNIPLQTIMTEITPTGRILRIDEPKLPECSEDDSCQYYNELSKSILKNIQQKTLELEKLESHEKILLENARIPNSANLNVNLLRESVSYIQRQINDVKDNKSKIKYHLEELQKEYEKVQNQLNQRMNYIKNNIRKITVIAEVASDSHYKLRLSYTTSNVFWSRQQEADVDEESSLLYLRNVASIRTDFREPWKNMRLTLIDKDFEFSNRTLEIRPLRVMFQSSATYRDKAQTIQTQVVRSGTRPLAYENQMTEEREELSVERGQSADASIFMLSGTYTLTYDKPLRAELYIDTLPINIQYVLAPYATNKVQLWGIITQNIESISPTPSLVRLNGRPVGINNIPIIFNSDSAAFHLGFINDVIVVRRRENPYKSRSFFGGSNREQYEYFIQMTSLRTTPVDFTLIDRVPVSIDNQIDVKFKGADANVKPDNNGILHWYLTLPPGQTKNIRFSFEITYPKNSRILFSDQIE